MRRCGAQAKEFLKHLAYRLPTADVEQLEGRLSARGRTLKQLQRALSDAVPSVISVAWDLDGSDNHYEAVVREVTW